MTFDEAIEKLEKVLKEKPNLKKLPGGSGYRNGYEDGYKLAIKRFKTFRNEMQQNTSETNKSESSN